MSFPLNLPLQCKGHQSDPWSGKIPHALEQLSLPTPLLVPVMANAVTTGLVFPAVNQSVACPVPLAGQPVMDAMFSGASKDARYVYKSTHEFRPQSGAEIKGGCETQRLLTQVPFTQLQTHHWHWFRQHHPKCCHHPPCTQSKLSISS